MDRSIHRPEPGGQPDTLRQEGRKGGRIGSRSQPLFFSRVQKSGRSLKTHAYLRRQRVKLFIGIPATRPSLTEAAGMDLKTSRSQI